MLLQGNLQHMFDALYEMGIIDPVLDKDWQKAMDNRACYESELAQAVTAANEASGDIKLLVNKLNKFKGPVLEYLAIEVAREFAEYHSQHAVH